MIIVSFSSYALWSKVTVRLDVSSCAGGLQSSLIVVAVDIETILAVDQLIRPTGLIDVVDVDAQAVLSCVKANVDDLLNMAVGGGREIDAGASVSSAHKEVIDDVFFSFNEV